MKNLLMSQNRTAVIVGVSKVDSVQKRVNYRTIFSLSINGTVWIGNYLPVGIICLVS